MPTLNSPPSAPQPQTPPDPLAGLRDIHTPAEISGLPIAPGWWILAALCLATLILGGYWLHRCRQQNRYRKEGLYLLQQTVEDTDSDDSKRLQNINSLLKRVALVAYPNSGVASFHGDSWTHFLQRSAPDLQQPPELPEILSTGLYASPSQQTKQVQILEAYASNWIKQHLKESKLSVQTETSHAAI
ncbi:DUF4381 domain-containing protein [Aestuariicella sp. G3-2]|uniref:DUF4381 domain-containing protein n=1 Tax=Pseudomaricurvus albidus TaxID=2842452 RepID=UPI001C0AF2F4|nr:DUF4381 domain-containing protein [Aestuariicella albida]MBU3071221.1 DUF4381 domain-containing protein [Aestuariicella albida]